MITLRNVQCFDAASAWSPFTISGRFLTRSTESQGDPTMLSSEASKYHARIARLRAKQGTRDATLSAMPFPSAELDAEAKRVSGVMRTDLGTRWGAPDCDSIAHGLAGAARSVLDSLSTADARKVARKLMRDIAEYAGVEATGAMEIDPSGTAVTPGGVLEARDVAADVRRRTRDASLGHLSEDGRRAAGTLAAMNAANRAFHAQRR